MKKPAASVNAQLSRRRFLAVAGTVAIGFPTIIPRRALGLGGRPAPSGRVTMAIVGWGFQGPTDGKGMLNLPNAQMVAACDLYKGHLKEAVDTINQHYKNSDCRAYSDYREMFARRDIDAIVMAVPDHWHALVATEAANQKKDVYGEKPLARTIAEQQAIVNAVERNGIIWQTGSQQRSEHNFRKAAEIVRNGLIGTVTHVEVGLPAGHHDWTKTAPPLLKKLGMDDNQPELLTTIVPGTPAWNKAVTAPPEGFNYETWIGPSRMEPYIEARVYKNWRWNYNTGAGMLMDWVGHHVDIAHWGLDFDRTGPSEIEGHGDFPPRDAIWNTCGKYRVNLKYPRNITMTIAGGHDDIKAGVKWIGTNGWVWVDRNKFDCSNQEFVDIQDLPENLRKVKLYASTNHHKNFVDCVLSRQPTIAPVQTGHHSAIPGHLGLISMLTGRKIYWDPATEHIIGDPEASKLLSRPYRAPYKLPEAHRSFPSPKATGA